MPILDPSFQYFLLTNYHNDIDINNEIGFFLTYLRTASRNIYLNLSTIETSIQFKEDIKKCIKFLNEKLKCEITPEDVELPTIKNIYKFLYNKISLTDIEKMSAKIKGIYRICTDQFHTKLFHLNLFDSEKSHTWFFSDTPIAILCVNTQLKTKYPIDESIKQSIKLEVDLMAASGYHLVLCLIDNGTNIDFFNELILNNQFSEIHFNFINDSSSGKNEKSFYNFSGNISEKLKNIKGYFYLYTNYVDSSLESERIKYKLLKRIRNVKIISYTGKINECLANKDIKFIHTKPFLYYKNGFNSKYLRIRLSNVSLYNAENDTESSIPSKISGIGIGYISPNDFLIWRKSLIPILFDDANNNHHNEKLYISFDDIHLIRPSFYTKDQLKLAKIKNETLKKVDVIENNISYHVKEKDINFIKENIRYIFTKDSKIQKSLEVAAFAYTCAKSLKENLFLAYKTQLYTAYEACKQLLNPKSNQKGLIFQVETGEGKTCIVCLIAAACVKMGKTVHVTSSNIKLSIRDFEDSHKFFRLLKISSALLVHSNELPNIIRKKLKEEAIEENNNKDKNDKKNNLKDRNKNKNKDKDKDKDKNKNKNDIKDDNKDGVNDDTKNENKDDIKDNNDDKKNIVSDYSEYDYSYDDDYNDNDNDDCDENNKSNLNNNNNDSIENDEYFGNNADKYFEYHTNANVTNSLRKYKLKYYHPDLFKNSSRMNFSVCGLNDQGERSKNKAKVIFSTFVNFECFYLKMVELCPASVESEFSKCSLLVDEADSILIDEIANGTIVSRSMKSNAKEILEYVYNNKINGISAEKTCEFIKNHENWKICHDLNEKDVEQMYKDIEQVNTAEYTNGKKYSIEEIIVKNPKKKNIFLKKVLNVTKEFGKNLYDGFIKEFTKDPNENGEEDEDENDDDDDDDDDDYDDENNENDHNNQDGPVTVFKHIVPFGYDHSGMLEPNKEFNRFIQQFIAIKESKEEKNKNMIINDISMSYLYVSHPIFVKLYGTVCGFTGTIGDKSDKELIKKEYDLSTLKVPRNSPNQRVIFPMILCKDIKERDLRVIFEIVEFHKRGNPVLVIFQDLKEIEKIEKKLNKINIKVNVFDGKDESIKPDEVAGLRGAVSIGTNSCGRGTDIKVKDLPLHVIITYYSSQRRSMDQAFGRTARQGKRGTCRIICLLEQYFEPKDILTDVGDTINEFSIRNKMQREFVNYYKSKLQWLFSNFPEKQKISNNSLNELRDTKINVNRIVAYNYKFPLCMSKSTFIKIQTQKIFSLFNCPNSKYTWILFQRYFRELILESWSLMMNKLDMEFIDKPKDKHFENALIAKRKKLYKSLDKFIPLGENSIVKTFIHVFKLVKGKYESKIMHNFSNIANPLLQFRVGTFFLCQAGFRPYALLSKSGARISYRNFKKTNYIKDPELRYEQKTIKKKFTLLSITRKIDDIFNDIFMKVNEILGSKTFLKLFLRRTLSGCEFGFCLTIDIKSNDPDFNNKNPYCIIDRDPLLVFTIFVRSMFPIMAIILISLLIYLGILAKKISEWFVFPTNTGIILKKTVSVIASAFTSTISNAIYGKLIDYLKNVLDKNIKKLKSYDKTNAKIIKKLKELFESPIGDELSNVASSISSKIKEHLGNHFTIKTDFSKLAGNIVNPLQMLRISAYLLLIIASFIMNFRYSKISIKDYKPVSEEYTKDCTREKLDEIIKKQKENNEIENLANISNINKISKEEDENYGKDLLKQSNSYQYKMELCNSMDHLIKISEIIVDPKDILNTGISMITKCFLASNQKKYFQVPFTGTKKELEQQVIFYKTNRFPSIIHLKGYSIKRDYKYLIIDYKAKGTLDLLINKRDKKIDLTNKLIISYGIARAMEHLHCNKIVHRNLRPSNIYIDSHYHPYLSNFNMALYTETPLSYYLKKKTFDYTAPEFIKDYKNNQCSFKIDVYSFGLILWNLLFEKIELNVYEDEQQFLEALDKGIHPNLPNDFNNIFPKEMSDWKDLISQCCDIDPEKRPSFSKICANLERIANKNKNINKFDFQTYRTETFGKQKSQFHQPKFPALD